MFTTSCPTSCQTALVKESITERFFRTPGSWTKLSERVFCRSINNNTKN